MGRVRCDCGCGLGHDEDVGDDVTDYCIEEAVMIAYEQYLENEDRRVEEQTPPPAEEPVRKPGEITDPVMAEAMRQAKEIHFKNTGVQT